MLCGVLTTSTIDLCIRCDSATAAGQRKKRAMLKLEWYEIVCQTSFVLQARLSNAQCNVVLIVYRYSSSQSLEVSMCLFLIPLRDYMLRCCRLCRPSSCVPCLLFLA